MLTSVFYVGPCFFKLGDNDIYRFVTKRIGPECEFVEVVRGSQRRDIGYLVAGKVE